jgi:hypothetical protein
MRRNEYEQDMYMSGKEQIRSLVDKIIIVIFMYLWIIQDKILRPFWTSASFSSYIT